jgi:hypothetical protein
VLESWEIARIRLTIGRAVGSTIQPRDFLRLTGVSSKAARAATDLTQVNAARRAECGFYPIVQGGAVL